MNQLDEHFAKASSEVSKQEDLHFDHDHQYVVLLANKLLLVWHTGSGSSAASALGEAGGEGEEIGH
jgi:hypothetical protein